MSARKKLQAARFELAQKTAHIRDLEKELDRYNPMWRRDMILRNWMNIDLSRPDAQVAIVNMKQPEGY